MDIVLLAVILVASIALGAGLTGGVLMLVLRWMTHGRQPIPAIAPVTPLPAVDRSRQ